VNTSTHWTGDSVFSLSISHTHTHTHTNMHTHSRTHTRMLLLSFSNPSPPPSPHCFSALHTPSLLRISLPECVSVCVCVCQPAVPYQITREVRFVLAFITSPLCNLTWRVVRACVCESACGCWDRRVCVCVCVCVCVVASAAQNSSDLVHIRHFYVICV